MKGIAAPEQENQKIEGMSPAELSAFTTLMSLAPVDEESKLSIPPLLENYISKGIVISLKPYPSRHYANLWEEVRAVINECHLRGGHIDGLIEKLPLAFYDGETYLGFKRYMEDMNKWSDTLDKEISVQIKWAQEVMNKIKSL